jgi:hypothetical protein
MVPILKTDGNGLDVVRREMFCKFVAFLWNV